MAGAHHAGEARRGGGGVGLLATDAQDRYTALDGDVE
jgi:hypothetical protein